MKIELNGIKAKIHIGINPTLLEMLASQVRNFSSYFWSSSEETWDSVIDTEEEKENYIEDFFQSNNLFTRIK